MSEHDVDDEVALLLSQADQRYTNVRRRVVASLQTGSGPMTITQILETDDSLSQSSVYRNLTILEDVGAVSRIVTNDDFARYELAEDLTGHHHHHLICSDCGDVTDFELADKIESNLDKALHRVAVDAGFTMHAHSLDLLGTCNNCA